MTGRAKIAALLAMLAAISLSFTVDAKTHKNASTPAPKAVPPKEATFEEKSVRAFGLYCITGLAREDTVAHFAERKNLPELPPKGAKPFLSGKPGKVFALPEVGTGIALAVPEGPACSVILQRVDDDEFIRQVNSLLDPVRTTFRLKDNRVKQSGESSRLYEGKIGNANLAIIFEVKPPRVFGAQAVIMAVRGDQGENALK